jgi:hypothetical protein
MVRFQDWCTFQHPRVCLWLEWLHIRLIPKFMTVYNKLYHDAIVMKWYNFACLEKCSFLRILRRKQIIHMKNDKIITSQLPCTEIGWIIKEISENTNNGYGILLHFAVNWIDIMSMYTSVVKEYIKNMYKQQDLSLVINLKLSTHFPHRNQLSTTYIVTFPSHKQFSYLAATISWSSNSKSFKLHDGSPNFSCCV